MVEEAIWYLDVEGRVSEKLTDPAKPIRRGVPWVALWRVGLIAAILGHGLVTYLGNERAHADAEAILRRL